MKSTPTKTKKEQKECDFYMYFIETDGIIPQHKIDSFLKVVERTINENTIYTIEDSKHSKEVAKNYITNHIYRKK